MSVYRKYYHLLTRILWKRLIDLKKKLEGELQNLNKELSNAEIDNDYDAITYFQSQELIKYKRRHLEKLNQHLKNCDTSVFAKFDLIFSNILVNQMTR